MHKQMNDKDKEMEKLSDDQVLVGVDASLLGDIADA